MIGKIVTGKSFKGAVEYVLKNEHSQLLEADGVDTQDVESVIDSFDFQRLLRPEIEKVVGHISLSFHPDDVPQTTDDLIRILGILICILSITGSDTIVNSCPTDSNIIGTCEFAKNLPGNMTLHFR